MKEIMKLLCLVMQLPDNVGNSCFKKSLLLIIARRLAATSKRKLTENETDVLGAAADFCKADTAKTRASLKIAVGNNDVKCAEPVKKVA